MPTTAVTFLAGPGTLNCGKPYVNESIQTRLVVQNIQTLSSGDNESEQSFYGPLFMPTLDPSDPCRAVTAQLVPENVTTRDDLPDDYRNVIGLAPWVSASCARAFLAASREQKARALIFYQPGNLSLDMPPPPESAAWDNMKWKQDDKLPIYAIPGPHGSTLMHGLALYSGHSRKHGDDTTIQNSNTPAHCARVYGLLQVAQADNSQVMTVEAAATIFGAVGIIATITICFWLVVRYRRMARQTARRQRRSIRRNGPDRITGGDIVLELQSPRPVVPQETVMQLPMYIYQDPTGETEKPDTLGHPTKQDSGPRPEAEAKDEATSNAYPKSNGHRQMYSQIMCIICLDEFVAGVSYVRELPCAHIFHPECIDTFLTNESNACPLCKATVPLPSSESEDVIQPREQQQHHDQRQEGRLFKHTWDRLRALMRPAHVFHDIESRGSVRRPGPASQTQEGDAHHAWRRTILRGARALLGAFSGFFEARLSR